MPLTQQTFERVALEDPEGQWELYRGRLREKPGMSSLHNDLMASLALLIGAQLDRAEFRLRINAGRVRHADEAYFIPDLFVIPATFVERWNAQPTALEVYGDAVPLVVEIWSPSTGDYDIDAKLPEYQRRGDLEIWRIHPYERTLTAWRRQADGSYQEAIYRDGVIELAALAGVRVDVAGLFD